MGAFWLLQGLGFLAGFLYAFLVAIHFRLPRLRSVCVGIASFASAAVLYAVFWECFPEPYDGRNIYLVMAVFPLILCLVSGIFRLPILQMSEISSPMLLLWFVFDRIGCQRIGRCASKIRVDWGFSRPGAQEPLFPLQLAEAAAILLIAVFLIIRVWRSGKDSLKSTIAWELILLGTVQFASSFLRDAPNLVFCFSEVTVWALFLVAEGLTWLAARVAFQRLKLILQG